MGAEKHTCTAEGSLCAVYVCYKDKAGRAKAGGAAYVCVTGGVGGNTAVAAAVAYESCDKNSHG